MNKNRRQTTESPTREPVIHGKTPTELMDEYVLTERQVKKTIGYT